MATIEIHDTSGGQVTLDWTDGDDQGREVVDLQITNYIDGTIEVSMTNTQPVGGFQFDLDAGNGLSNLSVTGASGGLASDAGFTVSTNPSGLVLGFSFSGATIPTGSGVLCYVDASFSGENGELSIGSATISDSAGGSLGVDLGTAFYVGVQEIYGCMDPAADNYNPDATVDNGTCEYEGCTDPLADNFDPDANVNDGSCIYPPASYTIYRDGNVLETGVDMMSYIDSGLGASQTYCYVVARVDMGEVIATSNEACATTDATVTQDVVLDPYSVNLASLNVVPSDNGAESVLGGLDLLLAANDQSDFYVPSYELNQIGSLSTDEGFKVVLNGADSQTLSVTGAPLNGGTASLNAFTMNLLPYLLQDCMAAEDVFAQYDDQILIVKNDDSDYYVPSFGVATLSDMCPGESYAVFLNGASGIDFTFPMGGALASQHVANDIENYKSRAHVSTLPNTGESHLILITDIGGNVNVGDQLRAYANDKLVGSINIVEEHINGTHPIDLVAVGSVDLSIYSGPVLPGYVQGDKIDLAYFSGGEEYEIEVELSDSQYGNAMEMSVGTVYVSNDGVNPTEFGISGNYPNPFNPNTTIEYNVETSGHVSLKIYDIMGRLVKTLVNDYKESGRSNYQVIWDGKDNSGQQVSAGLYLYTLKSNGRVDHAKMVLMK